MIEGVGTVVIARPPADIIAFVTDLEQYKRADLKIGRVYEQRREGDVIHMRHGGWLRGIPGPPVALTMRVDDTGAHYDSAGGFASLFVTFNGGFTLVPQADGTRVTHVERFHFRVPVRLVAEPFLRAWLQKDVEAEVVRLKALIEAAP